MDVVVEFDGVKNPLGEWCVQQQEYFESLPPLEVTPEQLLDQQRTFETVVTDILAHGEQVERTEEVALKFIREAEVCISLLACFKLVMALGVDVHAYFNVHASDLNITSKAVE